MESQQIQQSNINEPIPPNESAKKGGIKFGLSIAVVIICLVAAGVALYWIKTESMEEIATNVNVQKPNNETSGWQTYRNEEYGFEFKLPPKWTNAIIDQVHDGSYGGGEIFEIKLDGHIVCDIDVYLNEGWNQYQKDDTTNKPIYLANKGNLTFGWGCGQEDYGYAGFENYNKAVDSGNFDAINSGKILGPFAEFKSMILPTFKFIEPIPFYPGLKWLEPIAKQYEDYFEYDKDYKPTQIILIGQEYISDWINQEPKDFYEYYETSLTKSGWKIANHISADGPMGSIWGYIKDDKHIIFQSEVKYSKDNPSGPSECPCEYRYRIFIDF